MLDPLSEEEAQAVKTALDAVTERSKQTVSLNALLREWMNFVSRVEAGYSDSVYEYTNDLSVRDVLGRVAATLPEKLQERLLDTLRPYDEKYERATLLVAQPLAPGVSLDARWWWFRVPKRLQGELEADLRSAGVLDR